MGRPWLNIIKVVIDIFIAVGFSQRVKLKIKMALATLADSLKTIRPLLFLFQDPCRVTYGNTIRRNILGYHRPCADDHIVADCDIADDTNVWAYIHVVPYPRAAA